MALFTPVCLAEKLWLKVLFTNFVVKEKHCLLTEKVRLIRQANRVTFTLLGLLQLQMHPVLAQK
jgi:hypothetical protein